jgi:hypothetical protein
VEGLGVFTSGVKGNNMFSLRELWISVTRAENIDSAYRLDACDAFADRLDL